MNKYKQRKLILALLGIVIVMGGIYLSYKYMNSLQEKMSVDNKKQELSVIKEMNTKAFSQGDAVMLIDGSPWHVIENSGKENSYVTLWSDRSILTEALDKNGKVLYEQSTLQTFLKEKALNNLKTSLGIHKENLNIITSIRLITIDELKEITNLTSLLPGTILEKIANSFVYSTPTWIDDQKNEYGGQLLICTRDTSNPGRICTDSPNHKHPVRPVVTLKKEYVSKIISTNNDTSNDKNTNVPMPASPLPEAYKSYESNVAVSLINNSTWHTIGPSDATNPYVTLLSDSGMGVSSFSEIGKEIKYSGSKVQHYLEEDVFRRLKDSLKINDNVAIEEVRLLTEEEIKMITGLSDLSPGTVLSSPEYAFLYQEETWINNTTSVDMPILICTADNFNAPRMCTDEATHGHLVRPVIRIHKQYLK